MESSEQSSASELQVASCDARVCLTCAVLVSRGRPTHAPVRESTASPRRLSSRDVAPTCDKGTEAGVEGAFSPTLTYNPHRTLAGSLISPKARDGILRPRERDKASARVAADGAAGEWLIRSAEPVFSCVR
jgi:hypothetical protein